MKCLVLLAISAMAGFSAIAQKKPTSLGIINALAVELPKPIVSKDAEAACASGQVKLKVLVDMTSGRVIFAKAISGDPLLRRASVEAVRNAKFRPTNDFPLRRIRGYIVYNFPVPISCKAGKSPARTAGVYSCTLNAKPISLPAPVYPAAASAVNVAGKVEIRIIVDKAGKVSSAQPVSGHPLLRAAAVKAALTSRFEPVLLNDSPIVAEGIITYNFALR